MPKIRNVHSRHNASSEILKSAIIQISDETWIVKRANKNEYCTVNSNLKQCPVLCRVGCIRCQICIHTYTCNCIDNLICANLCKHIHAVAQCNTIHENIVDFLHDKEEMGLRKSLSQIKNCKDNVQSDNANEMHNLSIKKSEYLTSLLKSNS